METMDHNEAVQQMATERYLLDDLSPDLREAFEQHLFDCQECTLDLRLGAAFVDEAKIQLPELTTEVPNWSAREPSRPFSKKRGWFSFLRPVFNPTIAGPVFAALLAVVGYQNLVTYPTLRADANQPQLVPAISLHDETRGVKDVVEADRKQGTSLLVDVPSETGYSSFTFDLYDPQGKVTMTRTISAAQESAAGGGTLSLQLRGSELQQGTYAVAVNGITADGKRTALHRYRFDVQLKN
jgi:hypothetical protein